MNYIGSIPEPLFHKYYRGVWSPLKPGQKVRVRGLWQHDPIVEVLGTMNGEPFNLRGDQWWQVRYPDGIERGHPRAHLSKRLVPRTFVRRHRPPTPEH